MSKPRYKAIYADKIAKSEAEIGELYLQALKPFDSVDHFITALDHDPNASDSSDIIDNIVKCYHINPDSIIGNVVATKNIHLKTYEQFRYRLIIIVNEIIAKTQNLIDKGNSKSLDYLENLKFILLNVCLISKRNVKT